MAASWPDALDYLYGLANWETRPPGTAPDFELERIRAVLAALGDPQLRWPAVHVAGTNGKGSTCAMIAAVLRASGYRVGLYTSPHLHTIRERIQIDGQPIGERAVLEWLARRRATLDRFRGLTTFEALTALAFETFAGAAVDLAVVEVGLGGRLDTTNVVRPVVTVMTPIALDHTEVLGGTLAQIAADKCGIIRAGVPVVSAPQPAEARAVIESACLRMGAPLFQVGVDVSWRVLSVERDSQTLDITASGDGARARRYPVRLSLLGEHQRTNAATAVGALHVLGEHGWDVPARAVRSGLARVKWPARFEVLGDDPPLVLDGAHNPHGARALAAALELHLPGTRRHLILGCSRGKDIDGILREILPAVATVTATSAEHPRALAAADLQAIVAGHGLDAQVAASPSMALDLAYRMAAPSDVIVAAGSLFLAADVRLAWFSRMGLVLPDRDPPARSQRRAEGKA